MRDFVHIKTVFNNKVKRDIPTLSALYQDKEMLYSEIMDLLSLYLRKDSIYNKKILLKPNWVRHNIKTTDSLCLCTNEMFILSTLRYIISLHPQKITIGDAPIQGCEWDKLLSDFFLKEVNKLINEFGVNIEIKDFRKKIFNKDKNILDSIGFNDDYIIFDIGKDSYLEPITTDKANFRVNDYDHDKLSISHCKGIHKYCITKELFDADIVITLPKVKTHQKSGFTNSLKILVGINGDKDYLPHHRKGSIIEGGDCYPEKNALRNIAENIIDYSNKHIGKWNFKISRKFVSLFWKLSYSNEENNLGAAWYGNDTVWRMVLDINKIALYGNKDGTLSNSPQRIVYTLCDGIIAGQANGPLYPEPLEFGIISFSNNSYANDLYIAHLLQIDIENVPLLNAAKKLYNKNDVELIINGQISDYRDLNTFSIETMMPPGWANYKKKKNDSNTEQR